MRRAAFIATMAIAASHSCATPSCKLNMMDGTSLLALYAEHGGVQNDQPLLSVEIEDIQPGGEATGPGIQVKYPVFIWRGVH